MLVPPQYQPITKCSAWILIQRHRSGLRSDSAFGSPYNEMTQANSAIIEAIKRSMEYATRCMSMRSGNARYSATC